MTRDELREGCEAFVLKMCPHVPPTEQIRIVLRLMGQFESLGHITLSRPKLVDDAGIK